MNIDKWMSTVKECKYLEEEQLRQVLDKVRELLVEEENVISIQSPVSVCGDVHGQFFDVITLFQTGGNLPDVRYIFLGDYVDRGYYSLETLTWLLLLKIRYPDRITLLRGNHESREVSRVYGFYEEVQTKYGSSAIWNRCQLVFDLLPLSSLIDNRYICVHGGLSPDFSQIDDIRAIPRVQEIPRTGGMTDLMWSDPAEEVDSWKYNQRGAGWLFGQKAIDEFHRLNGTELVIRAHQLAQDGYKYQLNKRILTVWSAPNYCYRCGNAASILQLAGAKEPEFKIFEANSHQVTPPKKGRVETYFL